MIARLGTGRSIRVPLALVMAMAGIAALAFPSVSRAHPERESFFPDPNTGDFPELRTDLPSLVVCKKDSGQRIARISDPVLRRENLKLLSRCGFRDIQAAVNRAQNNYRILVLPGVYRELPSRGPAPPGCEDLYQRVANGDIAISYDEQRRCPNAENLIAILGDTDDDRICDSKCHIQIEGRGEKPSDVLIEGDRSKLNVIRADRADGIYLKNLQVEFSDFNNVYVIETNGFRIDGVKSFSSREYGILSFTSDHGIYENCETAYNGDSGVYPGAGPNGRHGQPDVHGHVYGIIIRNCESHHNTIGYSGTSGNGTWAHHNRFHDNAVGLTVDSVFPNHPGAPQDFAKWTENLFYSNNNDLFDAFHDGQCKKPFEQRDKAAQDPTFVCPSVGVPIGTGLLIAGGNSNVIANNYFFDNWRLGTMLFFVPAAVRGENDPSRQNDTSNNNRQEGNCMGVRPPVLDPNSVDFSTCSGREDPNGIDFWWDEEEGVDCKEIDQDSGPCVDANDGLGNCWVQTGPTRNTGPQGRQPSSDPALVPDCPGIDLARPSNAAKSAMLAPCATWDPQTNTDPPGCETPAGQSWFDQPPEPQPG